MAHRVEFFEATVEGPDGTPVKTEMVRIWRLAGDVSPLELPADQKGKQVNEGNRSAYVSYKAYYPKEYARFKSPPQKKKLLKRVLGEGGDAEGGE